MLEKINTDGHRTISRPDHDVLKAVDSLLKATPAPRIAEIGVGIGATTLPMCELLKGRGEIHIFDFEESVTELANDLADRGFGNVVPHGNTSRYWDSYHWSMHKLMLDPGYVGTFDLVYIDGAHTYLHDALAFFMCDRLLKVGGKMLFDDYSWRFADSRWLRRGRSEYMTEEQEQAMQIKAFIDDLVKTHIGYECYLENKGFTKVMSTHRL